MKIKLVLTALCFFTLSNRSSGAEEISKPVSKMERIAFLRTEMVQIRDEIGQLRLQLAQKHSLLDFGIQERFTDRANQDGLNLSTMVSWNPHFGKNAWIFGGLLGAAGMKSLSGNFLALRYQFSVSYRGLVSWFYPELLAGAESWLTTGGGTFIVGGMDAHFPVHVLTPLLESVFVGYHLVNSSNYIAQQFTLGLQISLGGGHEKF